MTTIEKIGLGIVAIGLVTTLVLPGRLTPQVTTAVGNAFSGALRAAQGR